ncbi:MAG: 16S rRNA (cytosine(1402)-N(4))-methyltransferase RsmH [bacterium]|nr:16S rRNA (cytosine(1402)-N(4))-methyltransferase RsmH [bacterium]
MPHIPVLSYESIKLLHIRPGSVVVDGTVGSGGHACMLAEALDYRGVLFCIDRDPQALVRAEASLAASGATGYRSLSIRFVHASYREARDILRDAGVLHADAMILDLGFSSDTLARGRGFSFQPASYREPLDMRYDLGEACPTAADILRRSDERTIATILSTYGEERFAARIARAIVQTRTRAPLVIVGDLVATVVRAIPPAARRGSLHAATRTFQALRIAVNRELDHLEAFLADMPNVLAPDGTAAVISFHSLEDRAVKRAFRELTKSGAGTVSTPKPVGPSEAEVRRNPRSRSAKLRVFQRSPL